MIINNLIVAFNNRSKLQNMHLDEVYVYRAMD